MPVFFYAWQTYSARTGAQDVWLTRPCGRCGVGANVVVRAEGRASLTNHYGLGGENAGAARQMAVADLPVQVRRALWLVRCPACGELELDAEREVARRNRAFRRRRFLAMAMPRQKQNVGRLSGNRLAGPYPRA